MTLLFFAMTMKRRFGPKPNPESSRCRSCNCAPELSSGVREVNWLFVVCRELLKPKERLVPEVKAWLYAKFAVAVFCLSDDVPVVTVFDRGNAACSRLKFPLMAGSKDSTVAPVPMVD